MIVEVKRYTDDDGRSITAYVPIEIEDIKAENIRYEGSVGVNTNMGVMPAHFPFPEGYSLEKCFEQFETIADEEITKQIKEAEEKKREENLIVTPGQASAPNMQIIK